MLLVAGVYVHLVRQLPDDAFSDITISASFLPEKKAFVSNIIA